MKLYYETPLGRLWHGNCVDGMSHIRKIDLVLTDPPYWMNVYKGGAMGGGVLAKQSRFDVDWDNHRPEKTTFDIIKKVSISQIIFGGNFFADYLGPSSCWIVWDKDNGNNKFSDCELAWTSFQGAVRKFKWRWQGMIKEAPEVRFHPTQKPVGLFMQILRKYSPEGEIILDPFLGSGTTAIACERLNRKWIGIEIEEKYCEIAAKRIEQERKQLKLF